MVSGPLCAQQSANPGEGLLPCPPLLQPATGARGAEDPPEQSAEELLERAAAGGGAEAAGGLTLQVWPPRAGSPPAPPARPPAPHAWALRSPEALPRQRRRDQLGVRLPLPAGPELRGQASSCRHEPCAQEVEGGGTREPRRLLYYCYHEEAT